MLGLRLELPPTNDYDLVIPPVRDERSADQLSFLEAFKSRPDLHHLYWPKSVFRAAGKMASDFCNHPFNQIWLPRFQHDALHSLYDHAVVGRYPGILIPSHEVMAAYLHEANILRQLGVSVHAVTMINEAIYSGISISTETLERREEKLEAVASGLAVVIRLELVEAARAAPFVASAQALQAAA